MLSERRYIQLFGVALTVHTATYNRAYILAEAYRSLQNQTAFEFEWLITDDGSTDNTGDMVRKWQTEGNRFPIRYLQLRHGGLIRAVNRAVAEAKGKYYFRLDSDDQLTPDAVETILIKVKEVEGKPDFVGVGFVIVYKDGNPIKGVWPKVGQDGYVDCTNLERKKYELDADMREAYKTDIIRRYLFPIWNGETFAPEQLQMNTMALDGYKLRWFAKAIYICQYQEDGLTMGNWNQTRKNPMGFAMLANQRILYSQGVAKYRAAADHIALSLVGKNPAYILKSNSPTLTMLSLPLGLILAIRRHNQYKWDDPIHRRNYL